MVDLIKTRCLMIITFITQHPRFGHKVNPKDKYHQLEKKHLLHLCNQTIHLFILEDTIVHSIWR